MVKLPRAQRRIGAALVFFVGVFFAVVAGVDGSFQLRPHGQPYAAARFSDWLVDLLGNGGAAAVFLALGAGGAVLVWRLTGGGAD